MKPMNCSNNRKRNITKRLPENCQSINKFLYIALICCCLAGIAEAQNRKDKQEKVDSSHSGHSHYGHEESKAVREDDRAVKLTIPDVEVLTQDGKQVKIYTDLIKDKKVMINFIYTSCGLTCPLAGRNFDKLQKFLGKDLGKKVFLISVSTDPAIDTPQILKEWGEKFNRQEGWTLVTGGESEMMQLLLALTGGSPQRGLHTSRLVLFDGETGAWDTTSSLVEPKLLLEDLSKLGKPPAK